jgi:hypothetical protein
MDIWALVADADGETRQINADLICNGMDQRA